MSARRFPGVARSLAPFDQNPRGEESDCAAQRRHHNSVESNFLFRMGPQTQAHPVAVGSTISVTSVPAGPMIPGSPVPPWLLRTGSMNGLVLPGPVEPRPPARFDCGKI